jgi:hypothetical protein
MVSPYLAGIFTVNDALSELKRLILKRLQGRKGQRIRKTDCQPTKRDRDRLGVDSAQIQTAREELLREGSIEEADKRGGNYRLTATGIAFLRQPSPPPFGYDETLLPYQKSYLLFRLQISSDRQASLAELCRRLPKDTKEILGFGMLDARDRLQLNRPLVAWLLENLADVKAIERTGQPSKPCYRLLPAGEQLLGVSDQYPTIKFPLKGEEINHLLAAARLAGKLGIEQETGATAETATPQPTPPVPSPTAISSELTAEQILAEFERLKQERYAQHGMVPIYQLRKVVAERFGQTFASHEVLDPLLKELRHRRHIRLVAIGNMGDATEQQLKDSIRGENETYFMIEDAHEPAAVR